MFDDCDTDKRSYEEHCLGEYMLGFSEYAIYSSSDIKAAFKDGYACALNKPKGER